MELIAIILCNLLVFAASTTFSESSAVSNGRNSTMEQKSMKECCSFPTPTASSLFLTCRGNQSHDNQCFANKIIKHRDIDQEKVVESLQYDPAWRDLVRNSEPRPGQIL